MCLPEYYKISDAESSDLLMDLGVILCYQLAGFHSPVINVDLDSDSRNIAFSRKKISEITFDFYFCFIFNIF
jgi:hypothetical protein